MVRRTVTFLLFFTISLGFGQEKRDIVEVISNSACDCISQINLEEDNKNKEINKCISESIVSILKKDNDKSDIQLDKKGYLKIEKYLIENCKALNQVSFTDNDKFEHATSNNILAQLAYDDGLDYMEEEKYENAINKFKKAIEIDPNFAYAWDNLGVSYRYTEQYEKAISAYKKSIEINPKGKMPLINIAVTYNLKKEYGIAVKYYQKYTALYPLDPEGYYGLSLIQYTTGKKEEGLDNMVHAYTIYSAQKSPYRADAAGKIGYMYKDLKKDGKLDFFKEVAVKYNLKFEIN